HIQAGREAEGATLYVNAYPCRICAKLIINAGIRRVVVSGEYSDTEGLELLREAGIEVVILDEAHKTGDGQGAEAKAKARAKAEAEAEARAEAKDDASDS
ncbi:MAG: deaminase, partial [Candidatus Alkanophagales archaeon]